MKVSLNVFDCLGPSGFSGSKGFRASAELFGSSQEYVSQKRLSLLVCMSRPVDTTIFTRCSSSSPPYTASKAPANNPNLGSGSLTKASFILDMTSFNGGSVSMGKQCMSRKYWNVFSGRTCSSVLNSSKGISEKAREVLIIVALDQLDFSSSLSPLKPETWNCIGTPAFSGFPPFRRHHVPHSPWSHSSVYNSCGITPVGGLVANRNVS
mmetsp:Transcript_20985/g.40165  ORF Transcript_20985/g.40165 Transcript_20985/m.40165 type:complete len:209 (+) Transcript_20985:5029-5655(+)